MSTSDILGVSDILAVTITPFNDQGEVDGEGLRAHLRRLAGAGVGIYLGGSGSGESLGLSEAEHRLLFATARDELGTAGALHYAAFEPRTARDYLQALARAEPYGFATIRLTVPDLGHGHVATATEVEAFLLDVLGAVRGNVSLVIGQPGLRSTPSPDLVAKLVERFPNLVRLEVGTSDAAVLASYIRAAAPRSVFVPAIAHATSALALGATGLYGPQINLTPHLHRQFLDSFRAGDLATASAIYRRLIGVQELLRPFGTVVPIKAALAAFGLPAGQPRLPRLPLDKAQTGTIVAGLRALDVPRSEGWE